MMECKTSFISIYIVCNIYIYIHNIYIYIYIYTCIQCKLDDMPRFNCIGAW